MRGRKGNEKKERGERGKKEEGTGKRSPFSDFTI